MKQSAFVFIIVAALALSVSTPVHAQFITLARKIKGMHTGDTDVATVILDARTFRVYKAVIDTLSSDPKIRILKKDPEKRTVEFNNGSNTVTMKVDSLETGLSQITVTTPHSGSQQNKETDHAVEAILLVCKKMGIKCTLD